MANYYFVGTLLPELNIGTTPEISFSEFDTLLKENLLAHDYQLARQIRRYYDIENLRYLLKGEPLSPCGNLNKEDLAEALINTEILPNYMHSFFEKYDTKETRLQFFPALIADYFSQESQASKGFAKNYLESERHMRLIQTAIRAKSLNRDLNHEFQFEDPEDKFVQKLLSQQDSKIFQPIENYESLISIFESKFDSPVDLHKAFLEFRFTKAEQFAGNNTFSIDRILATMVQLILVESWLKVDPEEGRNLLYQYIKEQA